MSLSISLAWRLRVVYDFIAITRKAGIKESANWAPPIRAIYCFRTQT